jgi:hypothetical protein
MTASFPKALRRRLLALTMAAALSPLMSVTGFAYTEEARQMCTGDAFRLCSSEIPDIPKITACMNKHRADLSPGCRAVMDRDMSRKANAVAQQ